MTFGGASAVLGWLFLQASILIRAKITSIQKDQISSMIENYCYYFSKITTKFRDEDDEHKHRDDASACNGACACDRRSLCL